MDTFDYQRRTIRLVVMYTHQTIAPASRSQTARIDCNAHLTNK